MLAKQKANDIFSLQTPGMAYYPDDRHASLIDRYKHWVYVCANKNAQTATSVPLKLYAGKPTRGAKSRFKSRPADAAKLKGCSQRGQKIMQASEDVEEILDHPLLDLLDKVNPTHNYADLFAYTYTSLELTGNAYWYIIKDNLGLPIEIYSLFPQHTIILPGEKQLIRGYEYRYGGHTLRYGSDEVIQYRYYNPTDYYYGKGKLAACIVAADQYTAAGKLNTGTLENGGHPDWALQMPKESPKPDEGLMERIKKYWRRNYGGRKSGGLGVTWGGAELKQISLSPRELNYLSGQKFSREEIAGVFGVPMSKLTSENVNRSNAESGDYAYMKDTILPMIRLVEQKLNEQLTPLYDSNLFFVYDNPVPEEKDFRLKERKENIQIGYSTVNEERQIDGREPIEGGDEPRTPGANAGISLPTGDDDDNKTAKTKSIKPLKTPSARYGIKYADELTDYFGRIEKHILNEIDKQERGKAVNKEIRESDVSTWFVTENWNKELEGISRPFIQTTVLNGSNDALQQVQSERRLNATSGRIIASVERRTGEIVSVNATAVKELRKAIGKAIEEGAGDAQSIKSIVRDKLGDDVARDRAVKIARTETIWSYNEGAVNGYKESGVVEGKEWLTGADDRLCEFCRTMDGRVAQLNQSYFTKGSTVAGDEGGIMIADYGDVEHPPLHPNCRCSIVPVIRGVD